MVPIEAVTVCVGYADLLRETARFNRPLLDRWLVVTSPADHATRDVCRRYSVECLCSDEWARDGAFSKGRLIDRGLAMLRGDGWTLHLDADVAMPGDLHQVLDDAHPDPLAIHGCDRLNVVGWDAWRRATAGGLWSRPGPWMTDPSRDGLRVGARVANLGLGYTPIGYWQLWRAAAATWRSFPDRRYPRHHGTAARTDVQHALQWDRRRRVLIPELLVWHIETEAAPMGANWQGRTTRPFGPAAAADPSGFGGYA